MDSHTMQSTSTPIMISTLLTSVLMEKFKFQSMYYGMIHGLLLSAIPLILANYNNINIPTYFDFSYLPYIILIIILCVLIWKIKDYFKSEYLTINMSSNYYLQIFEKYITYQEIYYPQDTNSDFGNIDVMLENKLNQNNFINTDNCTLSKQLNHRIDFDDKFLNIKGYYIWKQKAKNQIDKDKNILKDASVNYIELNIIKNQKINPKNLLLDMAKYNNSKIEDSVNLSYYKILAQRDDKNKITPYSHAVTFYTGKKEKLEIMETQYINTLFHPKKDELWETIKNNILNPEFYKKRGQVGRISYLFYGPPGTGKSTFAYRIAMCLFRHIISLDLRVLRKIDLYKLLNTPGQILGCFQDYKSYIYLFEEFDISIKFLYYKQKNNNKRKRIILTS